MSNLIIFVCQRRGPLTSCTAFQAFFGICTYSLPGLRVITTTYITSEKSSDTKIDRLKVKIDERPPDPFFSGFSSHCPSPKHSVTPLRRAMVNVVIVLLCRAIIDHRGKMLPRNKIIIQYYIIIIINTTIQNATCTEHVGTPSHRG